MKNYNKNIMSSYLEYLDANNLYSWAMSQRLPANNLKLIEDLLKFNETFMKNHNENSDEGYIFEVFVENPKE